MQADHISPKYITSCSSCLENCSEIHPSNLRHQTLGTQILETKIQSLLNQNYDQWLSLFEKLQTSIQHLIQQITQYLQKLDHTVNEYRNVLVLNQQQKTKQDQQTLSKAMAKLSLFKYNEISCDEIDRITQALKQKESVKELNLSEQFEMMEDKILFDLHEIVSMNFSCLQTKSLPKGPETLNKYAIKDNETKVKDLVKDIDATEISKKIQEIMKEQIQKIKPLINEQISKAKTQIASNPSSQQAPKVLIDNKQEQLQQKNLKNDYWTKIYGNFKDNYQGSQKGSQKPQHAKDQREQSQNQQESQSSEEQFDEQVQDQEQDQSQSSYQRTQVIGRSQVSKSQTRSVNTNKIPSQPLKPSKITNAQKRVGKFHCIVKVLVIIQKQMKFDGKICTRFLGGDKTGAANFMMEHSALLEPGTNILMKSIKWSNFNHEKQGQFTNNTKITLHDEPIKSIGSFRFGQSVTALFDEKNKQIQVMIGKENARLNRIRKQAKQLKTRNVKTEKPEEKKTFTRPQQQKPTQSQKSVPPQVNSRTQQSTQQVQQSPPSIFKKFKISQIRPGQTGLWITGQVLKIIQSNGVKKIFLLGDETGVVNCEILCQGNKQIRQGVYVYLQSFNVALEDGFIVMRKSAKGNIILWNEAPREINRSNKISQKKHI